MLPFARMLEYGNEIDTSKIVKIDATIAAVMILTSGGNLYGFGTNTYGVLGLGHSNPVSTVTLLRSGVKDFDMGMNDTVLMTFDNKVLRTGAGNVIDATNVAVTSWTDITDNMGEVSIPDIKKFDIKSGPLAILMNNGDYYCAGTNTSLQYSASGTTFRYAVPTRVLTAVKDIKGNYNSGLFVLRSDSKIYAGGATAFNQLGSNSTTTQNPNVIVYGSTNWLYDSLDGLYTFRCGTVLNNNKLASGSAVDSTATKMRIAGSNRNGALSLNITTGLNYTMFSNTMAFPSTLLSADIIQGYSTAANFTSPILRTSAGLYFCGENTYGQMGLNDTTHRYIYVRNNLIDSIVTDYSELKLVCMGFYCTYFVYDSKLYACGGGTLADPSTFLPGYSTAQNTFVQIQLPF